MLNQTEQTNRRWIKPHLLEKRAEFIWALAQQEYTNVEIGHIFNLSRQRVKLIVDELPEGWESPWMKISKIKSLYQCERCGAGEIPGTNECRGCGEKMDIVLQYDN